MPRAVRLWDLCTGHGCFPPRINDQASPNVMINSPGGMGRGSHRKTDHWVVHCLVGNTRIRLLSGESVKISELVDNFANEFVYSCTEDGKLVPGKIVDAFISTYTRELIKIHLDNGKTFTCSSDHLVMLRNGSYVRAKHLKKHASLMPLYTDFNEMNYEVAWDNSLDDWITTHKLSALSNVRQHLRAQMRLGKAGNKFLVVHHKNFKKCDNRPINLKWMGNQDHFLYHSRQGHNPWMNYSPEKKVYMRALLSANAKKSARRMLKEGTHNFLTDHPMRKRKNRNAVIASNRRRLDSGTHHFMHSNPMQDVEIAKKVGRRIRKNWQLKTIQEKEVLRKRQCRTARELVMSGKHHTVTDNPMKKQEAKEAMCRAKIVRIYKAIRSAGLPFTKATYENFYFSSAPGWKKMKMYFSSFRDLASYAKHNHSVIRIEHIVLDKKVPLYDLTIHNKEKTHNFALSCGIFVHNCCVGCHDSIACDGSPNVIVNHLRKCRVGDPVCCGSRMAQGSPNVFVNDPR